MNLFKDIKDCFFYGALIIAAPLLQCISLWKNGDGMFYISGILMVAGIAYDAWGRTKDSDNIFRKIAIWLMYIISAYLAILLMVFGGLVLFEQELPKCYFLFFLPFAYPIIVVTACIIGHAIRKRIERKTKKEIL